VTAPDPARRAAYDVLRAVRVADAYTNLALPVALGRRRVAGRDAAFATELASGTIRRRGTYDAILAECIDRPLEKVQVKVLDILRLGCHQLLSMRVPPHAAISTSVDLARSEVGDGAAGFTNAVLRKVSAHDRDAWVRRVTPDPDREPVG
jgi:16S rRNA (cytosine967-C5)-methyltransferase